jgi:glutamate formiminotransferase/glutamate formiminotransferase/formiminotetrahydrofolate cyclodeaminase
MVQVSMNLTDYRVTPLHVAFEAVQVQAALHGVAIAGCEVVGLVPQAALIESAADALRLEGFNPAQVLEAKIEGALSSAARPFRPETSRRTERLKQVSLAQLLDAVSAATPFPAGASVSALVGALSASLGVMGARLSQQLAVEQRLSQLVERLSALAQADGAAYQRFLQATQLPKTDPNRLSTISSALHVATEIPLEIAERLAETGGLLRICAKRVKPRLRPDAVAGLLFAVAAGEACLHIVKENLKAQLNQRLKDAIHSRIEQAMIRLEELRRLCYTPPPSWSAIKEKSAQALPGKVQKRSEMEIKVFNNNVEKALKVAKKKLAGEGLFRELKRRRYYEKPSVRKKAKQREAQRRRQKWLSKRKPE